MAMKVMGAGRVGNIVAEESRRFEAPHVIERAALDVRLVPIEELAHRGSNGLAERGVLDVYKLVTAPPILVDFHRVRRALEEVNELIAKRHWESLFVDANPCHSGTLRISSAAADFISPMLVAMCGNLI
jgi:hypothetical protein